MVAYEPDLPSAETTGIRLIDHGAGDQNAGQHGEVRDELGRLERGLGLGAEPPGARRGFTAPFESRSVTPPRVVAEVLM